ncbi:hypothetical protein D3C85_878390 [compost metagenome]
MGAGADGAGTIDDDPHRVLKLGHRRIEVGAQLFVFRREGAVQAEGQLAAGQAIQTGGDALHDLGLLAGRLGVTFGLGDASLFGGGALDLCLCFQTHLFLGVLFEGQDGVRHVADLVTTADGRNGDVQIAASQLGHGARHGLDGAAQSADQPGAGAQRDEQRQHSADSEAPVGLSKGGLLGLGARRGDHAFLFLDGGDGRSDIRQAGGVLHTRNRLHLGGGISGQGDQGVSALMKLDARCIQRRLLGLISPGSIAGGQIGQTRRELAAGFFVLGNEVFIARGDEGAHGVLLLDRRSQNQVRCLEYVPGSRVGSVGALQARDTPEYDQGGHPAGRDDSGEGQNQLFGDGQVLQHVLRSGGGLKHGLCALLLRQSLIVRPRKST